jgi:hypothetical protein
MQRLSGSSKKETEVGLEIQVSNATRPSSENVVHGQKLLGCQDDNRVRV